MALINREVVRRLAARPGLQVSLQTRNRYLDAGTVPEMADLMPLLTPLPGPADVHVRHQWPFSADPPPDGRWVVMQHWEFGAIPRAWLSPLQTRIDELWVASRFVREGVIASGVPADRVAVIPCGIDTALFTDVGPRYPLRSTKRVTFLFVGGTIWRKGVDLLLQAYERAFTADDDVTLVIKDFGARTSYLGQGMAEQIAAMQAAPGGPEIQVIEHDLAPADLAALYRRADCLVHPYRGEGFGLPIAEAMASGLPVIVPAYGACLDFCSPETAVLVPATVVTLAERAVATVETVLHPWVCEVEVPAFAAAMRAMAADPAAFREMADRGQARIRADFTWEQTVDRIMERLTALVQRPARRLVDQPAPFTITGRRRVTFVMLPDWAGTDWQAPLRAYLRAFGPADDVSLVLYAPPEGPVGPAAVETALLAVIADCGQDPAHTADLIVLVEPVGRPDQADLIVSADAYLPSGEVGMAAHREAARLYGRPIVEPVAEDTLRAVVTGC